MKQQNLFESEDPEVVVMTALTLWPEWLPTFTHMGKDIENRSWAPPTRLIGTRIALHAGKNIGGGSARQGIEWVVETARAAGFGVKWEHVGGHNRLWFSKLMLAVPEADAEPLDFAYHAADIHLGAIVATAEITAAVRGHDSAWAMPDSWHWVLRDVRRLPKPVFMPGRQGLWPCGLTPKQWGSAS